MAKVAVILTGCGFLDGSEIHESVLCLLALQQAGYTVQCFAPDILQEKVINHFTREQSHGERRNCLAESARIARGEVKPLNELNPADFDAVMIPGGFGIAANLSTFAAEQEKCTVDETLKKVVKGFVKAKKPIGATCISPAILPRVFEGEKALTLTLGSSADSASQLRAMGMNPVIAKVHEMVADEDNRIYTTPCYMEAPDLPAMWEGIQKVVAKLAPAKKPATV